MKRAVLPALALLFWFGCRPKEAPPLNGRVEAYLSDLAPRTSGRLMELMVKEGQRVKVGELLARLSAEELDAAVDRDVAGVASAVAKNLEIRTGTRAEEIAQGAARVRDAEAGSRLAEANLHRAQRLFKDGVMAQAELDRATTERDRAQATLSLQQKVMAELLAGARSEQRMGSEAETDRAKAILAQSRVMKGLMELRAPYDGIVIHRLREPGSVIGVGQAVLTVARLDQLWVRVYLPQPIEATAYQGMPVTVETEDRRSIPATLDEVASEPEYTPKMVETKEERVNLVYPARVNIPKGWDQGLLPGMAVDVRLPPKKH